MSWWQPPVEPSPEQVRAFELEQMRQQDAFNRWRRYFIELPFEELEMLALLLATISNSTNPFAVAKYYEGMITGAKWVREFRLGESAGVVEGESGEGPTAR